jgi:FkbM family methyltransferase
MIRAQLDAVRWVVGHPLNRRRRGRALARWVGQQVSAHVLGRNRLVPFIDDTRLYVGKGLTTSNMQHYGGLGEPDVMGFLLHYLRPDDLFVDIGANVGVMSVLAGGAVGARTVACEPDPDNFAWLQRNVAANRLEGRVALHPLALGDAPRALRFTIGKGATSRAALDDEAGREVACETLDRLLDGQCPAVLKADVEGFELPILRGATVTLAQPSLAAIVLELKKHGARYGFADGEIHQLMTSHGFTPHSYDPFVRRLSAQSESSPRVANVIFLRDPNAAAERLRTAPSRMTIWGQRL